MATIALKSFAVVDAAYIAKNAVKAERKARESKYDALIEAVNVAPQVVQMDGVTSVKSLQITLTGVMQDRFDANKSVRVYETKTAGKYIVEAVTRRTRKSEKTVDEVDEVDES